MKCAMCGKEFTEEQSTSCCKGCSLTKGCKLIKCPNCGYEWPKEPDWLKKLIKKEEDKDEK